MSTPCQSKKPDPFVSDSVPDSVALQLQNAKELAVNRLLRPNSFSNIVGVGLGRKLVAGEPTDTRCIRVYVQTKRDENEILSSELVPSTILDIPTDIIQVGRLGRAGNRRDPRDDHDHAGAGPGSSIRLVTDASNVNQGATGTLGAVVVAGNGQQYILSCNHVLNVNGRVRPQNTKVVTPSLSHDARPIATPGEFFIELVSGKNCVDCAIAPLVEPGLVKTNFRALHSAGDSAVGSADRGQYVRKDGAITGLTSGTVVDVNADFYVEYSFGTFLFTDQIVIQGDDENFAADGDSGSVVVDPEARRAVGLIFAESGGFAIACPLAEVLRQLSLKAPGLKVAQ